MEPFSRWKQKMVLGRTRRRFVHRVSFAGSRSVGQGQFLFAPRTAAEFVQLIDSKPIFRLSCPFLTRESGSK